MTPARTLHGVQCTKISLDTVCKLTSHWSNFWHTHSSNQLLYTCSYVWRQYSNYTIIFWFFKTQCHWFLSSALPLTALPLTALPLLACSHACQPLHAPIPCSHHTASQPSIITLLYHTTTSTHPFARVPCNLSTKRPTSPWENNLGGLPNRFQPATALPI